MEKLESSDRVHMTHDNSIIDFNLPRNEEDTVKIRTKDGSDLSCSLLVRNLSRNTFPTRK